MARVRLVDVARRVGVSAKTVSNVVNGTGSVSARKRDEILAVIEELGYQPNGAARQLRTGASSMVALGVPDLREPYFAELASAFCTEAGRSRNTVVVVQTHGDRDAERAFVEAEGMPELAGAVLSPLALSPGDLENRRSTVPLILVGEHSLGLSTGAVPQVGVDNVAAAAAATRHLLGHGRRRIAVIGAQRRGSTATSDLRLDGYRLALREAGITLDDALVGEVTEFTRAEGSAAAERLLAAGARFDGVFCFNDTLAFGAMYTFATRGIRVPDDVEVVGFDAIEEGRFSVPPFATVDPGKENTCRRVLEIIRDARRSQPRGGQHVVPFSVVDRSAPDDPR